METARHDSIDFFLGATTPAGFKGYFEPLRHEPGMQMYLIKSGPGCGKSTLMKRLARAAEQRGELTQRIHCASDPDSLDGVILPGQHRAIVDATAPHVVEPDAPGADEVVVSLYHTIDAEKLHQCTDEVKALFARNALLRRQPFAGQPPRRSLQRQFRQGAPLCQTAVHPGDAAHGRHWQRRAAPAFRRHPQG